jgi:hypothetical protein
MTAVGFFVIGLVIGANLGAVLVALCLAAWRGDAGKL